jgi:hypothetical protein
MIFRTSSACWLTEWGGAASPNRGAGGSRTIIGTAGAARGVPPWSQKRNVIPNPSVSTWPITSSASAHHRLVISSSPVHPRPITGVSPVHRHHRSITGEPPAHDRSITGPLPVHHRLITSPSLAHHRSPLRNGGYGDSQRSRESNASIGKGTGSFPTGGNHHTPTVKQESKKLKLKEGVITKRGVMTGGDHSTPHWGSPSTHWGRSFHSPPGESLNPQGRSFHSPSTGGASQPTGEIIPSTPHWGSLSTHRGDHSTPHRGSLSTHRGDHSTPHRGSLSTHRGDHSTPH